MYADDTQLCSPCDPSNSGESIEAMERLESCIEEIREWMTANYLCLNDCKTEFQILAGSKADPAKFTINHITVAVSKIKIRKTARNILARFDSQMDMNIVQSFEPTITKFIQSQK